MIEEPILKVLLNGEILEFYFEESDVDIYNRMLDETADAFFAGQIAKQFNIKKQQIIQKARENVFARAKEDENEAILSVETARNGRPYYITIYDRPSEIIHKIETNQGCQYNEEERAQIVSHYEKLMKKKITTEILSPKPINPRAKYQKVRK